jgi:hypothetical protein
LQKRIDRIFTRTKTDCLQTTLEPSPPTESSRPSYLISPRLIRGNGSPPSEQTYLNVPRRMMESSETRENDLDDELAMRRLERERKREERLKRKEEREGRK